MFGFLKGLKGLSALQQVITTIAVILLLLGGFKGGLALYKHNIKSEVIKEITIKEDGIKHEDIKRIKKATDIIDNKSDCDKLSIVYNADQCTKRQETPANTVPKATTTESENTGRTGQSDVDFNSDALSVGGVFSEQTTYPSLQSSGEKRTSNKNCHKEKVSDEYGLPVWVYDSDGLLVQQEIDVCTSD